jgi:hypothetical protein
MEELARVLRDRPLAAHQKVIALTFMHGSRRRLDARLREVDGLRGRFDATTIDSFAWRLTQRWRRLATHLGHVPPREEDFDASCELAARLLERREVAAWVALSFPVILVDEAQDLCPFRCAIVSALAAAGVVLLAFDEFQCLNPHLRPVPVGTWLRRDHAPQTLHGCRRTNDADLLAAALAVREGRTPERNGRRFKIAATPNQRFAATYLANAIGWRQGGGNVAVLTPSRQGGFAEQVIGLVRAEALGRQQRTYDIRWESNDDQQLLLLWNQLGIEGNLAIDAALQVLDRHRAQPAVILVRDWLARLRCTRGVEQVTADEIRQQLRRAVSLKRRYGAAASHQFAAMTIQQAKNREFDHVIIIWPFTVPNDADQKGRLLYNAITRAKRSCTVLVQSPRLLTAAPFTNDQA